MAIFLGLNVLTLKTINSKNHTAKENIVTIFISIVFGRKGSYLVTSDYNMVGVVVSMVISTMHEKSCIDSHNERKFEKSSKIQSFTHLAIRMI